MCGCVCVSWHRHAINKYFLKNYVLQKMFQGVGNFIFFVYIYTISINKCNISSNDKVN